MISTTERRRGMHRVVYDIELSLDTAALSLSPSFADLLGFLDWTLSSSVAEDLFAAGKVCKQTGMDGCSWSYINACFSIKR